MQSLQPKESRWGLRSFYRNDRPISQSLFRRRCLAVRIPVTPSLFPGVMQVIAAHKQKTEPGEDTAMEGSVAEDEGQGSSTARSLQDNEVFANHLGKGSKSSGHFEG